MTALVLGATATWAMVGLIWFVQFVHYPLLARFSAAVPAAAAVEHQRRTALALRRLIDTNWVRTIAWSARGVVLAVVLLT